MNQEGILICTFSGAELGVKLEEQRYGRPKTNYQMFDEGSEPSIEEIKIFLRKNKTAFLRQFYKQCFNSANKQNYKWFKETLLKEYLNEISLENLIDGLDQLGRATIEIDLLKNIENIKIVHGQNDAIAPLNEAIDLAKDIKQSQLIIFDDAGHLPFLRQDFKKRIYEN